MNIITRTRGVSLAVLLLICSTAQSSEEWEYTLSPLYLWATGIEGESEIGPVTAPVDISFSDALDNLDTILTFHFEAKKGKHGVLANLMHIGLDPESTLPMGAPVGIDLTNNILDLAVTYQLDDSGSLQFLYGLRHTDVDIDVTVGPLPTGDLADESWLDAFVGLRKFVPLSDRSSLIFRGDIGAGGSDMVWSASGLYNYQFKDSFSAIVGYRWMDYDYETGSGPGRFTYDVTYEGPVLGAVFHW